MTGRMITVADRDLSIFDFSLALRAGVGSLMIVPNLSPTHPDRPITIKVRWRDIRAAKVNAPLTPSI